MSPDDATERDGLRTAIVVLGMHRSGTSLVTHTIGRLGAALPADPNPATADNPEGYWEPASVVQLNDHLLRAADSAWLDTKPLALDAELVSHFSPRIAAALAASFGSPRCFVLKDPRICRMVPLYRTLLGAQGLRLKVVLVLRAPAAVAASLYRRDQMSPAYARHLWARHLLDAERHTRDLPRLIVSYDGLMQDWHGTAVRLHAFLSPELPPLDLDADSSPVRPHLHHHQMDAAEGDHPADELYDVLLTSASASDDSDRTRACIDALAVAVAEAAARNEAILDTEYRFQRLTSPYDTVAATDPVRERQLLAAALGRLHVYGGTERR